MELYLLFVSFSSWFTMSHLVKKQFNILIDSAIVVLGTEPIIHAMVFAKIGRYSANIEQYYMHTSRMMILVVKPVSKPQNRENVPPWREELLKLSCSNWPVLF